MQLSPSLKRLSLHGVRAGSRTPLAAPVGVDLTTEQGPFVAADTASGEAVASLRLLIADVEGLVVRASVDLLELLARAPSSSRGGRAAGVVLRGGRDLGADIPLLDDECVSERFVRPIHGYVH